MSAQELSTWRSNWMVIDSSGVQVDSLIVIPESLILMDSDTLEPTEYRLDSSGKLTLDSWAAYDSVKVVYRVLDVQYRTIIAFKDSSIIRTEFSYEDPFAYRPSSGAGSPILQLDGFEKRGSISRGIQVGNAQDLSVSSDLNLQLSGKISDRISLLANISDDNIPIQADGSTQQLQEFDQVYIKLFDERNALTAGDYQIASGIGYFSQYFKKARGALFETNSLNEGASSDKAEFNIRAGAAVSRGRFARNVVQGVEGSQGPYKLRGADNELFIIILSGTERIYIDGRLLRRGKEFDYVIDYNAAEITFTANKLITKDRRIVAEYQYAEQNYARGLFQMGSDYRKGKWQAFVNAYSEQDSRNQPLQQELDDADRTVLSNAGDDLNSAFSNKVDTVPFSEEQVLYALVDSLGYDSVFVFSTDPDLARYQLSFTRVEQGSADYVEGDFSANGRVYQWIAPDTVNGQLIQNGDYLLGILLITPKKQQLFSGGVRYEWTQNTWMDVEGAMSTNDLNTFSTKDSEDDIGGAFRWRGGTSLAIDSLSSIAIDGLVEFAQSDFQRIERYRAVEFERNWNLDESLLDRDQLQTRIDLRFDQGAKKKIAYAIDRFALGSEFRGLNHELRANWNTDKWRLKFDGSLLESTGFRESRFERHVSDISRQFGEIRIGFKDDRENNDFFLSGDSLSPASYRWYEWETYIAASDTSKWNYRLFFKNRDDWRPDGSNKLRAAHAEEYGLELGNAGSRKHSVKLIAAWRNLEIVRPEYIDSEPEETFLGRMEYRGRVLNGVVNLNTFYEVGSGLERRKQFVYLEVPTGQGVYVWVDYNEDGIRDLDEFEIAQFQYEANFIRVYTPTDLFEKTFTNQVSQNVSIDPGRVWRAETGWKRFVARISDQASWRADRKTRDEEGNNAFNPFVQNLSDTVLLALNNSLRNSVFFNKTDPVWGVDHRYSDVKNKQLLTNGFEARAIRENSLNTRYTIDRRYTLRVSVIDKQSSREASYSSNRDYRIDEQSLLPSVEWQPDRTFRLTLKGEFTERDNNSGDGESASISRIGTEARLSEMDKGSVNMTIDYVKIDFDGNENSSLAFEMLDGLRTGNNFTWSFFLQRNLAKNLAMNITYNGRKSEDSSTIHSGGVQVRAFF